MDYLIEAKKFIQQAQQARNPEVIKTDLEMAEWLLSEAIGEQERTSATSLAGQTERRPTS